MAKTLKILILEDSTADAEITRRLLIKEKPNTEIRLATNKETYLQLLKEFQPDIILSDHSLPQFNSTDALFISQQLYPDIPFIMVTGTVSEEFAADIIKLGADDYILKDRLNRLPSAIDTALKQRIAEKEKQEAKLKIIESETNLRAIFENTSEGFLLLDSNGIAKAFNNKATEYPFFIRAQPVKIGRPLLDFIDEPQKSFFREIILKVLNGESVHYERSYDTGNDEIKWIDFTVMPVNEIDKTSGVCITGRDITQRKKAEETLKSLLEQISHQKIQEQKKITRAILKAQESERNYIGQELHDNINQILAATKLHLDIAVKNNEELKKKIQYPRELINDAISEIRRLSTTQVTPTKDINLEELIKKLIVVLQTNTAIKTKFVFDLANQKPDDELKLNIYRIVQEQINNIIKHAAPRNVYISLEASDGAIQIEIVDDGRGFDTTKKRKGIGISNIINRVESFNGKIEINSSPGKGCKIYVSIPS